MKKFFAFLLCAATLVGFAGCSEKSSDDINIKPGLEDSSNNGSNSNDGYTFVKNITGYTGSSAAVTSSQLKLYQKGGTYYIKVSSSSTNYSPCSRNSNYSSSYTGRDPKKKYKYYAKPYVITYYFDL